MHDPSRLQSIWESPEGSGKVSYIDQTLLPHKRVVRRLKCFEDALEAIILMRVRGAPLIGVTAAFGMALAAQDCGSRFFDRRFKKHARQMLQTRPTAVNLRAAVDYQLNALTDIARPRQTRRVLLRSARQFMNQEIRYSERIGRFGAAVLKRLYRKKRKKLNILTHCNAGILACVKWGTATAPIYRAAMEGVPLHVWVDETRPRNQGASLTAWEMKECGIEHTVIADNAGAHLMQRGEVDLVITGADRVTANGDAANKIGTLLKAIAAREYKVPFWVAFPTTTIDRTIRDGVREIPIEERPQDEVTHIRGRSGKHILSVQLTPDKTRAANPAFDVTPGRLITGYITEQGAVDASKFRAIH
ncbi:MAG: S-methyl-5-thioribose-1-phosphate isomerase [Candidatus Omnitrophica bacterium]|nr:S-methyl-5-thioribose-1-phosphate isomerase [Candidatus Omnitrophota bacterium]